MPDIETTTDIIETPMGTWFYASNFLLRKYQIEDIGANQSILSEWLKDNNRGKVDGLSRLMPGEIIIPKDKFNVLRVIGIRLFGANNFGTFYLNHVVVLNIELMGGENDKQRLLVYINKCSYNQYKLYNGGLICKTETENKKGSKLYSTILEKGVEDTDTRIRVFIEPSGYVELTDGDSSQEYNINQEYGGAVTFYKYNDRSLILVYITGKNALGDNDDREKLDTWTLPPELALMHELTGHAIPQGLEGLDKLNALEIENKIRSELNITTLRRLNVWHTVVYGK